jgi:hypothetical protein
MLQTISSQAPPIRHAALRCSAFAALERAMGHRPTPSRRRRAKLSPEEHAEWRDAAGEFAWPETEDGEWDFLRPGWEPVFDSEG